MRDVIKHREYRRLWKAKRRADFFKDKKCVKCGSTERLELDHIDPSTKIHHNIWTWKLERRLSEIAKCQVLCHECHRLKTRQERAKINKEQVLEIRELYKLGNTSHRKLAKIYKITHSQIGDIIRKTVWKDI